jgi:hypothetical protein
VQVPGLTDEFERAVAPYRWPLPEQHDAAASPTPASSPVDLPPAAEIPWQDLALNAPGQAVRERAEELRAEMQQRSRIGTLICRVTAAKTDERAFRIGAKGEEAVGSRLERLTNDGWRVLHSVPVGTRGSDIDHVLIGPGGVYTINTKHHPGGKVWVGERAILVNGHKTDYLRNSRHEAECARKILLRQNGIDLQVRGVLVFLTGTVIPNVTIKKLPADVLVFDRMDLPGVFKRAPQRLDEPTIEQVFAIARRSTTWTGRPT